MEFEIIEHIGVLSETKSGWRKEFNLISWNGKEPKYDIRSWSPEHENGGRGSTLSLDEIQKLKELLKNVE